MNTLALPAAVPSEDQIVSAHGAGHEVAWLGDFGAVTDIEPATAEDRFALARENGGIAVGAAINAETLPTAIDRDIGVSASTAWDWARVAIISSSVRGAAEQGVGRRHREIVLCRHAPGGLHPADDLGRHQDLEGVRFHPRHGLVSLMIPGSRKGDFSVIRVSTKPGTITCTVISVLRVCRRSVSHIDSKAALVAP